MVEQAKRHIYEGDIFQAVVSRRFETKYDGSLLNAYRRTAHDEPFPLYGVSFHKRERNHQHLARNARPAAKRPAHDLPNRGLPPKGQNAAGGQRAGNRAAAGRKGTVGAQHARRFGAKRRRQNCANRHSRGHGIPEGTPLLENYAYLLRGTGRHQTGIRRVRRYFRPSPRRNAFRRAENQGLRNYRGAGKYAARRIRRGPLVM